MSIAESCEVLVAEDQEHVREALAMLLRGKGYSVTLCSSPLEAITAAEQRPPDIALVDMNYQRDSTSGIEGLDLIERLRKVDHSLPVIALTAWGNVDLAVNAMKSGASDFIEKPWRNDSLLEKVGLLTSQGRQLRSSQRISDYERQDAQVLQTRIVPQRHIVSGGIELFGDSIPAGVVGGDYFGAWQPSPDVLHFCVADVSGKGTPGALIAAMLYASVSTLSSSSNRPENILHDVEKILQDKIGGGHYITAFYGVLQLKTHVLEYVNAGHCPPILRRGGQTESLAPTRPVLGLLLDADFRAEHISLLAGDQLLLYTDGVTEAANPDGEEFGSGRLAELAASDTPPPMPDQWKSIMDQVRGFADGKLTDDATLLLLNVQNAAGAAAFPSSQSAQRAG
jgi:sigma-B regulation protein RsbU (phosphoserine phosphatase)